MDKLAAILITFFLGGLGVHRFMAGKIGTGISHTTTHAVDTPCQLAEFVL